MKMFKMNFKKQIIYSLNSAPDDTLQPKSEWFEPEHVTVENLDQLEKVSISVSRCLAGFPFVSRMSFEQFSEVEKMMRLVFKNAAISIDGDGLTGRDGANMD